MNGKNKMLLSKLQLLKANAEKGIAILIDPAKDNQKFLSVAKNLLQEFPVDFIFVGGSFVEAGKIDECINQIRNTTDIPIVLFPGDYNQLSSKADSLLFLSLISGRNPDFLIEQQVKSVPWLRKHDLEVVPTSYLIVSNEQNSSVLRASNTKPLSPNNKEMILDTCLAGYFLGHKLLYLDGGSGCDEAISPEIIKNISDNVELPLICGGGIKTPETASEVFNAGADLIVIGNALEKDPNLLKLIYPVAKKQLVKDIQ